MISVNGYRIEKLYEEAHQRLATRGLRRGQLLHLHKHAHLSHLARTKLYSSIAGNMEKLADSLNGMHDHNYH